MRNVQSPYFAVVRVLAVAEVLSIVVMLTVGEGGGVVD